MTSLSFRHKIASSNHQRMFLGLLLIVWTRVAAAHTEVVGLRGRGLQASVTRIHEIQGSRPSSLLVDEVVTVEAIVVGDFQDGDDDTMRNLRGFFLQEEDADADNNEFTSEGIFVYEGNGDFIVDVTVGDLVQVTGTVTESFGETQIRSVSSVVVLSSGNPLPSPAQISLPFAQTTLSQRGDVQPDLERFEGMLVEFVDTLTVTEQFQLDRFNEIKLVQGDRPFQFTQLNLPNATGYANFLEDLGARRITYDDGENLQNRPISNLDGFGPTYNTSTAIRMGDQITGLTGVLSYTWAGNSASGGTWRVRSTTTGSNVFQSVNVRPVDPPSVGGTLKLASVNVLNYFVTLDERGADTETELARQTEKLVAALVAMDADIFGLLEIENNYPSVPESLVSALNNVVGAGTYAFVDPGMSMIGDDAIAVGFLYKPSTVRLGGQAAVLTDSELGGLGLDFGTAVFDGPRTSRSPMAATFYEFGTGGCVTLALNHFKSKGSACDGDPNLNDGAGNCNLRRDYAAQSVAAWLATDPTGVVCESKAILGDLNAYAMEDPIRTLAAAGYSNVVDSSAYSFVFHGQLGTLDYVLANAQLQSYITGAADWHINADEADALDYNLDFGKDPAIFDGSVPYRFSDHDPILVGMTLGGITDKVMFLGTTPRFRDKLVDFISQP